MITFVITKFTQMKERLLEFLRNENKTSAQLAEEIGVQASGISHILSGRNNPSLDFVLKMLEKYQFISTDWLLFGKGSMYSDSKMHTLFDYNLSENRVSNEIPDKNEEIRPVTDYQDAKKSKADNVHQDKFEHSSAEVVKIVWFYDNNSFVEYLPRK
jgi:transcriptional regulator with XRE-family HTH domain